MSSTCPWCKEPLGFRERRKETCPHCGRALSQGGDELRPVDLRYDEVEAAQCTAYTQLMTWGTGTAALIFLALPVAHYLVTPALVVPLVLVAHMLVVRLYLVRRSRQLLSPMRRFFVRWILRLVFLWIGSFGYGLTSVPVPVLTAIPGVLTYVGLTALSHHYALWSLKQEHLRRPLATWEKLTLLALILLTLALFVTLVVIALLVGFTVAKLIELASGG